MDSGDVSRCLQLHRCHWQHEWADAAQSVDLQGIIRNTDCQMCLESLWRDQKKNSLRVLLWQLEDGVAENKRGVCSCWYGGAKWDWGGVLIEWTNRGGVGAHWQLEDCVFILSEGEHSWVLFASRSSVHSGRFTAELFVTKTWGH